MSNGNENPAETAGRLALEQMFECLESGQSFRLEAGAGAGKTYSLEKALRHLIDRKGAELLRRKQQIGCITFTNVAKDQITSRIQAHPSVRPETVHGFCWSILQDFQTALREFVPSLPTWTERLAEFDGIGTRRVNYELGYPGVTDENVSLRHEDVLALMIQAMEYTKFRRIFTERYPILLIDEYQDTDAGFVAALKKWFWDRGEGPLVGLFGDHWQKIYGEGCGLVEHDALQVIEKKANFRSAGAVVDLLNQMRPELPQVPRNPDAPGEARVFHTNEWPGVRRTGQGGGHWTDDTNPEAAQAYFQHIQDRLRNEGWDFSVEKTKILMLSHSVLAGKQGYASIPPIYRQFRDPWLKKEDPHIKFMTDHLEPACAAFEAQHYGEMIAAFGEEMPRISRHQDKVAWSEKMKELIALRQTGTIGDVVDFIADQPQMRLPAALEEREKKTGRSRCGTS